MAISEVIAHIDREIEVLQTARAMLAGESPAAAPAKRRQGRPKGSKNAASSAAAPAPAAKGKTRRNLSPEGRQAIADAMKRRWAERRKQTAK